MCVSMQESHQSLHQSLVVIHLQSFIWGQILTYSDASLHIVISILFIWFSFTDDFYTVLIDIAFFKLNSGIIIFLQYQWR